jgi:hypothetical protein
MDKVQNPSNPECHTLSSEPFTIYLNLGRSDHNKEYIPVMIWMRPKPEAGQHSYSIFFFIFRQFWNLLSNIPLFFRHTESSFNFMELSPSWEAANCAATQEIPKILFNQKVHSHIHNSPPLVPILSQINPVHIIFIHSPIALQSVDGPWPLQFRSRF